MRLFLSLAAAAAFVVHACPSYASDAQAESGIGSVTLHWTAPGDDSLSGRAAVYELRWSPFPTLLQFNFLTGKYVAAVPKPGVAGTAESFTVNGLVANQAYYFAIRTADDAGNWSPISNVVRKLAVGPVGVSSEGVRTTDVSKPWPNPARSIANLAVSLAAPGDVAVDVFDLMGRHVRTLAKGPWPMGDHSTTWDLRDDRGDLVPSAMYKVRARLGTQEFVRSVVVVR